MIDEVILVDGRSTDGTVAAARELLPSIKVILEPAPGKGVALRRGYAAAQGDIIVVLDADGSNDPREIPRFVRALLEGADFVKGSRFAPLGGTSDMPRIRKLGNEGFVRLANLLFGCDFSDLCYGYHAFWRYCLDSIPLEDIDGFEIDAAIYLRALQARLRIVDVPSFEGYRFYGVGKLKIIPDGWRVLRTIVREWRGSLFTPALPPYMGFRRAPGLGPLQFQAPDPHLLDFDPEDLDWQEEERTGGLLPASEGLPLPAGLWPSSEKIPEQRALSGLEGLLPPVQISRSNGNGHNHLPIYLDMLAEIHPELTGQVNRQRLLRYVLGHIVQHLQAASGSILVVNDQGAVTGGCLAYQSDYLPLSPPQGADVFETGFAGWVASHRAPAVIADTRDDPRWLLRPWEARANQSRSALGVPILSENRVLGVLTVVGAAGEARFTEEHLYRLVGMPGM